ncbi:MAG: GNAT family N-acetyltransferase [Ruminococcaceae bacterium]|nr:GNAT family N-acetyltransferase [Oscillospiraceae bacterium]
MDMKIEKYEKILPPSAMTVRTTVFVEEQGFVDEYDEIDGIATHFVMFDGTLPVATCRIFCKEDPEVYYLGRLAVMKAYRGRRLGAAIVQAAEDHVRSVGGTCILLHSQRAAEGFYAAVGYIPHGEPDEEQGCPHIWMKKSISNHKEEL